jgi:hypothetical protein
LYAASAAAEGDAAGSAPQEDGVEDAEIIDEEVK